MFDQDYLKELRRRYEDSKKKYAVIMIIGVFLLVGGAIPFLFERKDITSGEMVPYFPVCVVLIAFGFYIFIRTLSILEAYKLLAKNEEYINRTGFKLLKKMRKKVDNL
ncbi:O-antigen/teichoic acid export membrane protein [Bacillus pakistanensis]|uniref:O-antigen/teichoic acid export membrane protein n=1 Tax=Rossellomorea pakistanensis TaxID=992288 RepID=A0ABS2NBX9_9BACI|nr:O-antigen/teichoic acid export membrane protein [Bacillus pakistanensis]